MLRFRILLMAALALPILAGAQTKASYQYFRVGSPNDLVAKTHAGFALMGGGEDLDEAFRWMCGRAGGGDFLVVRASGDDEYNPSVQKLCPLNSVATLIISSREAANDPFVEKTIADAEAIFIAGGDQANYIRFWMGTPVQKEINDAIRREVPIGGTSAGLAVMGEWAYSAEGDKPDDPNLDSKTALANPMGPRVTLVHGFLDIPILKGIITDTHFVKRDRMGRLLVFLARMQEMNGNEAIHGIGIDEKTAVLLDPNGEARIIGAGTATFIWPSAPIPKLSAGNPLERAHFYTEVVKPGGVFSIRKWCCGSGPNTLIVEDGKLREHSDSGPVD